jgi:selenide,water dikinase
MLVGFDTADDAGVYQISPETALVQTVDFFTPIVDDPYTFGQIAAVNALSDVYAMGGRPLSALALVCFPEKADLAVLEQILAGGLSKMVEAGCTVVGGHSIRDPEIKFGYSVTGTIHPKRVLTNAGAQPGDALLLTKALGTGVISTAIKRATAEPAWIDAAAKSMTTLNRAAAEVITRPEWQGKVHAMTDVTGFGLIGHAREMALAAGVSLTIDADRVPLLSGALECVRAGYVPGGLNANRDFAECVVEYRGDVPADLRTMLFDPQTAGGLLISLEATAATDLQHALRHSAVIAEQIGRVNPKAAKLIQVVGT